jgi:hypothetical protein
LFIVVDVQVDVCPACSGVQETVMVRLQLAAWRAKGEARRRRRSERNHRGRGKGSGLLLELNGILSNN